MAKAQLPSLQIPHCRFTQKVSIEIRRNERTMSIIDDISKDAAVVDVLYLLDINMEELFGNRAAKEFLDLENSRCKLDYRLVLKR